MSPKALAALAAAVLCLACASTRAPPLEAKATIIEEPNTPAPAAAPARPAPPPTAALPVRETLHGREYVDPYRWLEDVKAPEVQQWMSAQNDFARAQLDALPGREALEERLEALLYVDQPKLPIQRGGRLFYIRKLAEKEKGIGFWRPLDAGQEAEKVLLDPNKWTKDGTVSLGAMYPSWDGKWVAFTQKPNAADEATLRVAHVESTGWSKVDVIEGAKYASPDWLPDGSGFFYEYLPTDKAIPVDERPGHTEIRFHKLGSDPKQDEIVFPATRDPTRIPIATLSHDGRYLLVYEMRVGGIDTTIHYKRLGKDRRFRTLVDVKGHKVLASVWKDDFYLWSTEGSGQGRIFKTSTSRPQRKAWKELIPEDPKAFIAKAAIIGGHLSLEYLRDAASELRLFTLSGKPVRSVPLPGLGNASNLYGLPDSDVAFFTFSSFVSPEQVYRTDLKTGAVEVWGKAEVPVDPSPYTVEQTWFTSKDGTRVSMFLVHRKDLVKDGSHPTLLYGYGGFSIPMLSSFSPRIYPWLEAGGVYAVAQLRGGNEYGEAWHQAGMREHKQNTFDDFIAAAEHLIAENYTRPERLGIRGGSNGGLLVGAAMVQRPELFGAVICGVPLLDMLRYHLFGSGRTWIPEYGTAEKAEDFQFLAAYSPYQQVKEGTKYPPLLMMAAAEDDRVDPMHARKFVAKVQAAHPDNVALLRIESNAGHGGADQVRRTVGENVDLWAWLLSTLGEAPAPAP